MEDSLDEPFKTNLEDLHYILNSDGFESYKLYIIKNYGMTYLSELLGVERSTIYRWFWNEL